MRLKVYVCVISPLDTVFFDVVQSCVAWIAQGTPDFACAMVMIADSRLVGRATDAARLGNESVVGFQGKSILASYTVWPCSMSCCAPSALTSLCEPCPLLYILAS